MKAMFQSLEFDRIIYANQREKHDTRLFLFSHVPLGRGEKLIELKRAF